MKVKVWCYMSVYSTVAYNSQIALWNITDNFSEIWGTAVCNSGQDYTKTLIGQCNLNSGTVYTIDFGAGSGFNPNVQSFGLVIEEILDTSVDTFQLNNNSVQSLKVQNTNSDIGVELFNQNSNNRWRM